jgi:RpiB/LacA/LacB family sugar-phosphate isomerase
MKIYLGTDHGGFKLKEELKDWLVKEKYEPVDLGARSLEPEDDFVDYAFAVADVLQLSPEERGILFCRNGVGVAIAANRFGGVRCALGFDKKQVTKAREDDDVNCLAIPADYLSVEQTKGIVKAFLETKFSGEEKYQRRLEKLESESCGSGCCSGSCGGSCGGC